MHVVYILRPELGWHPVTHMARMAADLFEAELTVIRGGKKKFPQSISSRAAIIGGAMLGIAAPRRGSEPCLVICPTPIELATVMSVRKWRSRFGPLVAWVIDSFSVEKTRRSVRFARAFEHVFVTRREDTEPWRETLDCDVTYLPWGCDALELGSSTAERPIDLLRVGRQPAEWDDDETTSEACNRAGLRFAGKTPIVSSASENQRTVMEQYSRAKYVLAFSNTAHESEYTDRTRSYITGRWTDALACGASVAGVPPDVACVREILWPGALLPFPTVSRSDGLRVLSEAVRGWSSKQARLNHLNALKHLDWRLRLKSIADRLDLSFPRLDAELEELSRAIDGMEAAVPGTS